MKAMPPRSDPETPSIPLIPVEILIKIFDLIVETDECLAESRLRYLQSLSAVCRSWRHLIDNTTSLWATIMINPMDHPKLIKKALERSSPAALDITLLYDPSFDIQSLLLPHIDRIRSWHLMVNSSPEWREFFTKPAPALEIADIHILYGWEDLLEPISEVIFGGTATKLRVLRLRDLQINIGRPVGLKEYHFTGGDTHGPTLGDTVTIIRGSPDLEELVLDETALRGAIVPPLDGQTILLPRLRKLKLDKAAEDVAGYLLNLIDAPNLETFDYNTEWHNTSHSATVANAVLKHARNTLNPVSNLSGFVLMQVRHWESPFHVMAQRAEEEVEQIPEDFEVSIALHPQLFGALVQPIVNELLSHLQNIEVTIEFHHNAFGVEEEEYDPMDLLSAIPHIAELSLDQPHYTSAIVQWLGQPQSDGSWPCPHLKNLKITTDSELFVEDLLEMVRSRYGGPNAPAPLELLSIRDGPYSKETWAEIVALVGEAHTAISRRLW